MKFRQRSRAGAFFLTFMLVAAFLSVLGLEAKSGPVLWSFSSFGNQDYFHQPSDIAVDSGHQLIYVADSGNNRIAVFDFDGRFVRSIGREGQGPGEFSRPTGICILDDSRLAVADFGNNRIQIFDASGELEGVINTKEIRVADLLEAGGLLFTIPSFGISGYNLNMRLEESSQPLVEVLDMNGNELRRITTDRFPETHPFIRAIKHRVGVALSPQGKLYLPFFAVNLILVFDLEGELIGEIERPLPFKPIMPELQQQRSSGDVIQMMARTDMVSQSALFGPDGLLYVLTYTDSLLERLKKAKKPEEMAPAPMRIDVIDPRTDKPVRTLDCEAGTRAFALLDSERLVVIFEDEEGELVFRCRRIPIR